MKFNFKKKYGQHILINSIIINKIITFINPKYNNIMVEIGPGSGALTMPMIYYNNNMTIIEIDKDFYKILLNNKILNKSNTKIILDNALNIDYSIFTKKYHKKIRIFGSLPYNIATQLLFLLFNFNNIKDMHFIMQKEIIQRLIAHPGNKYYGCLSIMSQIYCKIKPLIEIKPCEFYPIPKVFSQMVCLRPYIYNPYHINNITIFKIIIQTAFSMRRKTLRNSLKNLFTVDDLNTLGIDYKIRAENVSIMEYCQLAKLLESNYKRI
ncbi:16S rRNA (adenine(1518)-N(6)/adenine(1519)-N(6))-dimethyltransferase RsmA [Enterobacteriaceae endosymbiont of Neohaemonia nigricornis]|uniref:16S rRNA (adenine(1518)-N(6)/adenine(1519)-N(6))- dimethyltransferase RsmA n=1 Tax=Enterobacteriaceae endosymbiont of Neohaemonia nigricornis TaxID=2675792 RepID=UPI0014492B98|nr:16S rRNA (adenine(1518)-N(6)/adenine(1519)-N(6))-dimethyltransferase RsmA [Enterobacteriaceae endosymbiont of Neohaemonia nigricornis]QJC30361.1 16S rRNA (adenine(1518)-N(6)/adenine(1519)-N(6))-dimethyltransferase RsmA [Enterobacteriaceae endosymbiont of Neohaemonia nigricornis]